MTGQELIEYIKKWELEHEPVGTDNNMTGLDLINWIIEIKLVELRIHNNFFIYK